MRNRRSSLLLAILSFVGVTSSPAHDFWLEPSTFSARPGDTVSLTLRVGQDLKGDSLPYIDDWFSDYRVLSDVGERPIAGTMGDDPAGHFLAETTGTHLIGYRSTNSFVELESRKFHDYLAEEGLESAIEIRTERGEGDTVGREYYSRCAKALVSVGDQRAGKIFNRPLGYTLEIIPEEDPFAIAAGDTLPIQLLYLSEPIEGVLVVAFTQDEPQNRISVRTDVGGRVRLKLDRAGVWLVKAVHIIETPAGEEKADWESFWASLTFRLDS